MNNRHAELENMYDTGAVMSEDERQELEARRTDRRLKLSRDMNDAQRQLNDIDAAARSLAREHRLMFGALAMIRAKLPRHLGGAGADYLSQLLEFRRAVEDILNTTDEQLGLTDV